MPDSKTPEGVIEYNGMLWKPRRGATSTPGEFIAAQTAFKEILDDGHWNPWVREDRAAEYDSAMHIIDQWRRAEPGHRMLTMKQLETRWVRQDREREQARKQRQRVREARKASYDEERATARVALFEQQSLLRHETSELAEDQDGTRFPKMDEDRRREKVDELEKSIERRRQEIERLTPIVGDPEHWRALNMGTIAVLLEAAAPRVNCDTYGPTVRQVPWARHGAGHTRAFDAQVAWLATHCSKRAITELMRIAWHTVEVRWWTVR